MATRFRLLLIILNGLDFLQELIAFTIIIQQNAETYGNLYNWYAVDDPRGIAPEGGELRLMKRLWN